MPGEAPVTTVTSALAANARAIVYDTLPADVCFLGRQCLLDWFGVALAGSGEPLTHILRDEARETGGNPQSTLAGTGERMTMQQAALINGAASHAHDFDDVHMGMSGHPTVPIAPAVLALAEARGMAGRDVLAAFVAGFETECRAGALVMPGHYATGFHATGTLGTFGAAAACAHLLRLDETEWLHALGIAGTQAAGLKAMFGTMCKPLHAGKAAANGLAAALWAARGFSAHPAVLDVAQGFAATQTPAAHPDRALEGLGERFAIRDVLFKYHASCFGTHATIEALRGLREAHQLTPGDVVSVHLRVPLSAPAMCNIQEPATALEGKFSLRFTAALALAGGGTTEEFFTDQAVRETGLVAIRDRVTVEPDEGIGGAETEAIIRTSSGQEYMRRVDMNRPATDLDRQWAELAAKFRSLAEPVIGGEQAARLLDAVAQLDDLESIADLMPLCGPRIAVGLR